MCGLVGGAIKASNGFYHGDTKVIEELLYIDALRGKDSTGIGVLYNDGEMRLLKDIHESALFISLPEYEEVNKELVKKGKAVIGHNRKKTSGSISAKSAHPFLIKDVDGKDRYMFAHNGTLYCEQYLLSNLQKNLEEEGIYNHTTPTSGVDSETLGTMLCLSDGNKEKIENLLVHVNGAYACTWIDQETETLFLLRNKERPLFIAHTPIGIFWASEMAFLYAACARNKVKIEDCVQLKEDTLYSIDLRSTGLSLKEEGLSIKKALPVSTTGTSGIQNTGGKTTKSDTFRVFSKNQFKKFQKKWIGTVTSFPIEDYIEKAGDGNGSKTGYSVWGWKEGEFGVLSLCRGQLEPMEEATLVSVYLERNMFGRITGMYQDHDTGRPVILFDKLAKTVAGALNNHVVH